MKNNPVCFNSQRIKNEQFIKYGRAIISSPNLVPTCSNDIKLLVPGYCPQLPQFMHGKNYNKVSCFDNVNAKQSMINILNNQLNETEKVLDIQKDKYEQLKIKYHKLQQQEISKKVAEKKTEKILEKNLNDVQNRYRVCCLFD